MKQILVDHKVKKQIVTEVGTTYNSVAMALLGVRDTDLTREIRKKAIQLGGVYKD